MCYPAFYKFFEQKRILEKVPKTKARKAAELNFGPAGYERKQDQTERRLKQRAGFLEAFGIPISPRDWDIDHIAARNREAANYDVVWTLQSAGGPMFR